MDEDAKFLEVTLKRRGYLGETSFVSKYQSEDVTLQVKIFIASFLLQNICLGLYVKITGLVRRFNKIQLIKYWNPNKKLN